MKTEKKRIAIVYDCPYPYVEGGGQKRFFEIATRLIALGWEIDWYCLKFWEESKTTLIYQGIRFIAIGKGLPLYGRNGKRSIKEALYFGWKVLLRGGWSQYNLVWAGQWPLFHIIPLQFHILFSKTKLVLDWWEVWGHQWFDYLGILGGVGYCLEKILCRIPHHLISISEMGKKQLLQLGVKENNLSLIHNGINFSKIQLVLPSEKTWDIAYLGRLKDHKNVSHLIEAIVHLKKEKKITACIIGDGPQKQELEELAKKNGVLEQVHFLGRVTSDNEVYAYLKSAKLFVMPSTKEGGGSIVAIEANACGLAVVAYDCEHGIAKDIVIPDETGYFITSVNSAYLAEGIKKTLNRDEQVLARSKAVCIGHAKGFDWASIVSAYIDVFNYQLHIEYDKG